MRQIQQQQSLLVMIWISTTTNHKYPIYVAPFVTINCVKQIDCIQINRISYFLSCLLSDALFGDKGRKLQNWNRYII